MLVDGVEVPDDKTPEVEFEEFFNTALDAPLPGDAGEIKSEPVVPEPVVPEPVVPEPVVPEPVVPEPVVPEPVVPEVKEDPRVAALERELAEVKAAVVKPVVVAPQGPTPEELKQTEEENAVLADYEKNWEDHAKAQKINNKRLLSEVEKIFNQVVSPLMQKIPGIEQTITKSAQDKALDTVLKSHSDAVELIPAVDAWISTLPKYLQKAASETLDGGSPADVVDLYNDFKESTGRAKVAVAPEKEIVKPEENKRVLSLVSPKSSRTGVAASVDSNDFDGAFKEALKVV